MKVCHVSSAHHVLDDRIFFKECRSLAKAGWDVSIIGIGENAGIEDGVTIIPLQKTKGRFQRFVLLQIRILYLAFKTKASVFHFHDPDLIIFGLIMKLFGKKVIYDMHELVYYQILDKHWLKTSFIKNLVANIYKRFEGLGVIFFDKIIIAEDGYWEYANKNYQSRIKKFESIRNFSVYEIVEHAQPRINEKDDSKFTLVYAGGLSKIRGINEIIIAIQQIPNIAFWLLGPWENDKYENECKQSDVNNKVKYIGQVKMSEVYQYLKVADVGIANLYHKPNYLNSLPIKAFEYMACAKPIIMSDFPLWIQTFSDCALFVNPQDVNDIKQKVILMMENAELRNEFSTNGQRLVKEKFTWEAESFRLVNVYKEVLNEG